MGPSTARMRALLWVLAIFLDSLHEHVDVVHWHFDGPLHFELDRLLKVVGHLGDSHAVLNHDVYVDREAVVDLADLNPAVEVVAAQQLGPAISQASGGHGGHAVAPEACVPGYRTDRRRENFDPSPAASIRQLAFGSRLS